MVSNVSKPAYYGVQISVVSDLSLSGIDVMLVNGEDEATLASVLAFVDAFQADEEQEEEEAKQQETRKSLSGSSAAKRRRVEIKYTTQLQRRRRVELSELRGQAAMLETRLRQLQRVKDNTGGSERAIMSTKPNAVLLGWVGSANKQLRARLEEHSRLGKEIEKAIEKHRRQEEHGNVALSVRKVVEASTLMTPTTTVALEGLPRDLMLSSLVDATARVFEGPGRIDSSWVETTPLSRDTEIRSSTISKCSVTEAAKVFWPKPINGCPSFFDHLCVTNNSYSRESLLTVRCRPWDPHLSPSSAVETLFHAEHHARRLFDPASGRVVIVVFAFVRLLSSPGEVLLREYFWRCIDPVDLKFSKGSVTRTCYRIGPGDTITTELSPVQSSIMRALVRLTHTNHVMYQEWLLGSF